MNGCRFIPITSTAKLFVIISAKSRRNHHPTALVVDDDRLARFMHVQLMRRLGYEATETACPEVALDLLGRQPFDLLITDFQMPDMNGLALSAEAKRLRPDLNIILVTGYRRESLADRAHLVDCIISKPCSIEELDRALKQALAA